MPATSRQGKASKGRTLLLFAVACALLGGVTFPAFAEQGDCSQPVSFGEGPSASDCLFILKVAVSAATCAVECACAPKGALPISASDALLCLRHAVGQQVELDCPCGVTSTTLQQNAQVQDVQDGLEPIGAIVRLHDVFVTGISTSASGAKTFFVQEAQGVSAPTHPYPRRAGVRAFASTETVASLPDLGSAEVGDCVALIGEVAEFQGATQVTNLTEFDIEPNPATCGDFPLPLLVPASGVALADVATDTDAVAAGDQAGAQAEEYEGVLLRVDGVEVQSVEASGGFRVGLPGGGPGLLVHRLIFNGNGSALPVLSPGATFVSITGLLTEAQVSPGVNNYRLVPRGIADLVQ